MRVRGRSDDGQVVRWTSGEHQVNLRWTSGDHQVNDRWTTVEIHVNVESQSELDIGGRENCHSCKDKDWDGNLSAANAMSDDKLSNLILMMAIRFWRTTVGCGHPQNPGPPSLHHYEASRGLQSSHHPNQALGPKQGIQPDPEPQGQLLDGDGERSE